MEFWEKNFKEKKEMWGLEPAISALLARDFFMEQSLKNILIPGIGYGRNARVFMDIGMEVTGIEISETAIALAQKNFGNDLKIFHGSVLDMPFDAAKYDGIYCHALIHLLDEGARSKLIADCFNQLTPNGYMVFTAISKRAPNYGKGKFTGKDRYEFHEGAKIFYYDLQAVHQEFSHNGLIEVEEIDENQPMYLIKCKKEC